MPFMKSLLDTCGIFLVFSIRQKYVCLFLLTLLILIF